VLNNQKRALYHAILVASDADLTELDLKIGFLLIQDPYIQRLIGDDSTLRLKQLSQDQPSHQPPDQAAD
jgi:hypothetical protein